MLSALVLITESIPSVATDFPLFEITKKFDDIQTYNNDYAILKFQEQGKRVEWVENYFFDEYN